MGELWELLRRLGEICGGGRESGDLCRNISWLLSRELPPTPTSRSPTTLLPSSTTLSDFLPLNLTYDSFPNDSFSNSTLPEGDPNYDTIFMAVLSIILGVIILITVIGNVFVIAAILLERNLQNVANYLIVSLAVADLMVACLVMPLGAVYEISRGWILGPELCDMWTSSDVLCCTASILHLVAIAVDRYWAVTNVDYIHNRNGGRIVGMIVVVWGVALVVSLAPQFGWKDPEYLDRINIQQRCLVSQDVGYQIFATCSTFYVPLLVILVLYWKIFQTARKRIRRRRVQRAHVEPTNEKQPKLRFLSKKRFMKMKKCKSTEKELHSVVLVEGQSSGEMEERSGTMEGVSTTAFVISDNHNPPNSPDRVPLDNPPPMPSPNNGSAQVGEVKQVAKSGAVVKRDTKKESLEAKRERKAAKTLAIITGAFVACWLPFFVMALLMPLCEACHINDYIASFFLWLGYFNSTLNPVIYTIFSPEFRQAFKRILCGVSHSSRTRKLR